MDKTIKILLVDNEPDVASMAKMRLEADGYEVFTASDGNTAYDMLQSVVPDAVIYDVMLPGIGGYQFCQRIKTDSRYRHIPVLILTAKSQKEDKEFGKKAGADCYLTKPFEAKELLGALKELLADK